jgi:hypothetical protein
MESQKTKSITYEKSKDGYITGIDIRDSISLSEMSKLIIKGLSYRLNYYSDDRVYFCSKEKLK